MALKKVLITGANSYVGTSVEKWLMREPNNYYVETLDMKDSNWVNYDFSKFHVVFHVAGIAHIKEKKKNKGLFHLVNFDLAIQVAEKSKSSGVVQFILMSTMSVYGLKKGVIDKNTKLIPNNEYGKSKKNAEIAIQALDSQSFNVVIVRPPMIYGTKSIGNYTRLSKFVRKFRIFPSIDNKKSFIYIDHFSEFIKLLIFKNAKGIFHPQNSYLVTPKEIVYEISNTLNIKVYISKVFNLILLFRFINIVDKIFSELYYDFGMYSEEELNMIYLSSIYTITETIIFSEVQNKKIY